MRTRSLVIAMCLAGGALASAQQVRWPTLEEQLKQAGVKPGTALEKLIKDNQDFKMLRPEESRDKLGIPPWLRVYWRKSHPELKYSASDPTGGYPLALKELYQWMITHQDLKPGPPDPKRPPVVKKNGNGDHEENMEISGTPGVPRSESSIQVHPSDPKKIVAASNNIGGTGEQAQYFSLDGGATWAQRSLPLVSNDAFHSDPTVDWSSDGTTAWSTTIGVEVNAILVFLRLRAYTSNDAGATWTFHSTLSGNQIGTDKQMTWLDRSPTSPHNNNLYAIWHTGFPVFMNRLAGGQWGTPIQVSGAETTGTGIGSDVKTNRDGVVFGFWPDTGSRGIFMVRSTDGGVSYSTPVSIATTFGAFNIGVPAFNVRRAVIYVSAGTRQMDGKNIVYASWTDLSGAAGCRAAANEPGENAKSSCKSRIWFSRSTNGGQSWSAPVMLNNQPSLNDQFGQWLAVDDATGVVSIVYYDSVGDATRRSTNLYLQSSCDDGVTWGSPVKVTTAPTDETTAGADDTQYGDYNGLAASGGRIVFPSWTDRRNGGNEQIWTDSVSTVLAPLGTGFSYQGKWGTGHGTLPEVKLADFNGDGLTDVAQFTPNGRSFVWLASNCGVFEFKGRWGSGHGSPAEVKLGDFNGDGKADVAQFAPDGTSSVWLSNGTSFLPQGQWGSGHGNASQVMLGRFDLDKTTDVVQFKGGNSYVWLSNGSTAFTPKGQWGTGHGATQAIRLGDFDADGRTDVAQFTSDGRSFVWLSNGANAFVAKGQWGSGHGTPSGIRVGDFDADHATDVVQFSGGTSFVWLSDKSTAFTPKGQWGTGHGKMSEINLGDFDGDERIDVAQFTPDGKSFVWLSNGTSAFVAKGQWGSGHGKPGEIRLGRFNNDKHDDVAQFAPGGASFVWLSTGQQP